MTAIELTENQIQRAVFDHIRQRGAPGVFAFHPKNGGVHQKGRRRGINAGLGVVSGVPDVIAIREGKVYAIELKTEKGKVSEAQFKAVENIRNAGGFACICHGLDRALACLETWGIIKGVAA
jgi:hypothetical protein